MAHHQSLKLLKPRSWLLFHWFPRNQTARRPGGNTWLFIKNTLRVKSSRPAVEGIALKPLSLPMFELLRSKHKLKAQSTLQYFVLSKTQSADFKVHEVGPKHSSYQSPIDMPFIDPSSTYGIEALHVAGLQIACFWKGARLLMLHGTLMSDVL